MRLDEIGTIVGGATPSTKKAENYGGNIPWITPKDLSKMETRWITQGERNITEQGLSSCSAQILPKNTVLFSSRAPIGYIGIAKNPVCTNQGFKSIIPDTEKVDPIFLYYLLLANRDKIIAAGSGTTFKEVSGSTMRAIEVRIPQEISYQAKIAEFLGCIDSKIEINVRINKNLFALAYLKYEDLVTQDTDGSIRVSDIAITNPKTTLKKGHIAPYIEMSNLNSDSPEPKSIGKKSYSGGMKFQNGDSLLARITPCLENGKAAFINRLDNGEIGFGSTEYIVFRPYRGIPAPFLYCLIKDPVFLEYAKKRMNGTSGRQRVPGDSLLSFELANISEEQFSDFGKLSIPLFEAIKNNAIQNEILAQLRNELLPKLLSGVIEIQ